MKNYVIFNGKSTEDIALIEELPVVSRAERDIDFIEIDGRHGFLTFDKNRYKPVDYSIELKVNGKANRDLIRNIFIGNGDLILSNESDRYYKAVITGTVTVERQLKELYKINVSFKLQPFSYVCTKETIIITSTPYIIDNPTNTTSQPIIKIYGSGTSYLNINGNIIELKNITSDGLILDFELKEAYDFNKVSKNTDVFGVYKEFIVGSNTISWTDNITKIEVTPNWRYL